MLAFLVYLMELPYNSLIAHSKLKDYLLVPKKRNDKSKWLAQIGYNLDDGSCNRHNKIIIISS
ncbi:MAG: hypothetical protein B6D64_09055 [Bacteroidetes bacterium 4484_276]|nr:MAG: hypothetical protein B6D64_09055 [Bacteroidetes bacterium 4484_276]